MSEIYQFEVLNPKKDKNSPFLRGTTLIVPKFEFYVRNYCECKRYNEVTREYDYFILLGEDNFNSNCKTCRVDDWGRLKLQLIGEIYDFAVNQFENNGRLNFDFIQSTDEYKVFKLS